jgi:hypothetical protein
MQMIWFNDYWVKHLSNQLELLTTEVISLKGLIQKNMSALTDLQDAVGALTSSISAEIADVTTALARIPTGGGTADADIEAVVAKLQALKAQVDAESAVLVPPPPPPPAV